jgi:aminoglycoside phosphotransferase (APT) family kinase protein
LAIVTAEARGSTLSVLLEREAAWWPSPQALHELGSVMSSVGGWLRAFHAIDARDGVLVSLDDMRAYIDVRLRRLLAAQPPRVDDLGRERTLRYFDRTAALVDTGDLREVLTHSDLAPSNILVNGKDVTVIDFAMVTPGSVFMDVARLYTQLEFLTAKPKFRPAVVQELQRRLLDGFDPALRPERPLFRLFLLQHLLCHMSNLARNPAPALARLYNRHQLRLRQRWLQTFAG